MCPWSLGRSLRPCPVLLYVTGHGPVHTPLLRFHCQLLQPSGRLGHRRWESSFLLNFSSSYAASSVLTRTAPLTILPQCSQIWPGSLDSQAPVTCLLPLLLEHRDGTTSLFGFSNLPQYLLPGLTALPTPLPSVPSLK